MTQREGGFDPTKYIQNLKGKDYLGARHRLMWLRSDHPDWTVVTSIVEMDFKAGYAIVRAEVLDETGRLIANGTKSETKGDFGDFLEKAETGAIGRACAVAGYGTETAIDLDEGTVSDAPVERKAGATTQPAGRGAAVPPSPTPAGAPGPEGRSPRPSGPTVPPEPEGFGELFGHSAPQPAHNAPGAAVAGSDERMTSRELFGAAEAAGLKDRLGPAAKRLWGTGKILDLDDEQRAVVWAEVQRV